MSGILCQPHEFSASFPDSQCLTQGNLWTRDLPNRHFMLAPSQKSALWSFAASILISPNWNKIDCSFPYSQSSFPPGWHSLPSLPSPVSLMSFSQKQKALIHWWTGHWGAVSSTASETSNSQSNKKICLGVIAASLTPEALHKLTYHQVGCHSLPRCWNRGVSLTNGSKRKDKPWVESGNRKRRAASWTWLTGTSILARGSAANRC